MADDTQLLQQILQATARLDERQQAMQKTVDRIDRAIYGNGSPGLRQDVDELRHRVDIIDERHAEIDENKDAEESAIRKFRLGMIGTAIAILVDVGLRLAGIL